MTCEDSLRWPNTQICSGHGTCISGVCVCDTGWSGYDEIINTKGSDCGTSRTAMLILWSFASCAIIYATIIMSYDWYQTCKRHQTKVRQHMKRRKQDTVMQSRTTIPISKSPRNGTRHIDMDTTTTRVETSAITSIKGGMGIKASDEHHLSVRGTSCTSATSPLIATTMIPTSPTTAPSRSIRSTPHSYVPRRWTVEGPQFIALLWSRFEWNRIQLAAVGRWLAFVVALISTLMRWSTLIQPIHDTGIQHPSSFQMLTLGHSLGIAIIYIPQIFFTWSVPLLCNDSFLSFSWDQFSHRQPRPAAVPTPRRTCPPNSSTTDTSESPTLMVNPVKVIRNVLFVALMARTASSIMLLYPILSGDMSLQTTTIVAIIYHAFGVLMNASTLWSGHYLSRTILKSIRISMERVAQWPDRCAFYERLHHRVAGSVNAMYRQAGVGFTIEMASCVWPWLRARGAYTIPITWIAATFSALRLHRMIKHRHQSIEPTPASPTTIPQPSPSPSPSSVPYTSIPLNPIIEHVIPPLSSTYDIIHVDMSPATTAHVADQQSSILELNPVESLKCASTSTSTSAATSTPILTIGSQPRSSLSSISVPMPSHPRIRTCTSTTDIDALLQHQRTSSTSVESII